MGMRDNQGRRISSLGVYPTGILDGDSRVRPDNSVSRQPILPDLADPATIGCLLDIVREAHSSLQSTEYIGDGDPVNPWRWGSFRGTSEAESLVNALEGAP